MHQGERSILAEVNHHNFQFGEDIEKDRNRPFIPDEITESEKKVEIHWDSIYDKAIAELGLQQTKRDQLITIYIAWQIRPLRMPHLQILNCLKRL